MSPSLLDTLGHPRLLVLGDLILDRYTSGDAERVSPEAPVLVLRAEDKEIRLGGAASVAMLLRGLEASVVVAGVIGDDPEGRALRSLLRDEQTDDSLVIVDPARPTTTKERFLGRTASRSAAGNQMLRVDHESRAPLSRDLEDQLLAGMLAMLSPLSKWGDVAQDPARLTATQRGARVESLSTGNSQRRARPPGGPILFESVPRPPLATPISAILISDYAKGVCTPRLLDAVIRAANERHIPVIVDPARIADYSRYAGATLLKPNRVEAELATDYRITRPEDAIAAGRRLCLQHDVEAALITLDRDGMALIHDDESAEHFVSDPRDICDITGAGDMVLAALGLCLASNLPLPFAAQIANIAASLEIQHSGVTPISRNEIAGAVQNLPLPLGEGRGDGSLDSVSSCDAGVPPSGGASTPHSEFRTPNFPAKLITLAQATSIAATCRSQGQTLVFTNGCFDLLHIGHVTILEQAAALGDVLIVAVNSDASVRRLKGNDRPIIPEQHRAQMLAALACVDYVLLFDDSTPHVLLEQLRPHLLVKGGTTPEIVGHKFVESYGGRAVRLPELPAISTTALLATSFNRAPGTAADSGGRSVCQAAIGSEFTEAPAPALVSTPHSEPHAPHFSHRHCSRQEPP